LVKIIIKNKSMFKNILIGALFGVFVLYYAVNTNYQNKYAEESKKVKNLRESIVKLDSVYISKQGRIDYLKDSIFSINNDLDKLSKEKEKIQNKYDNLKNGLDTVSIDSLAKYIINNYKGNTYKILDFEEEGIFMSFTDTTVRDIVYKDLERNELIEEKNRLVSKSEMQEELIKLQSKQIDICSDQKEVQKEKINKLVNIVDIKEEENLQLKEENSRLHKKAKILTYVTTTGVVVATVIILL